MFNHAFSEKIFPDIHSEPSLEQLEIVSPCAIASCLGGETNNI